MQLLNAVCHAISTCWWRIRDNLNTFRYSNLFIVSAKFTHHHHHRSTHLCLWASDIVMEHFSENSLFQSYFDCLLQALPIKSYTKIKIKPMTLNSCNERYFSNDRNWNEYTNASLCVYYHKNSNENHCLLYARFMRCLHLVECEFWSGDLNFWIGLKCNYIRSKSLF